MEKKQALRKAQLLLGFVALGGTMGGRLIR
jgi:hypothetical protein